MGVGQVQKALGALLAAVFMTACGMTTTTVSGGAAVRPEGSEAAYNVTTKSYSGTTITIRTHAQFERYEDYDTGNEVTSSCTSGTPCKVGLVSKATYDIRYAETHLYDAAGTLIQAGETDGSGMIDLVIPKTAGTYRLEVHSRSDNANLKASVLNNPYEKTYYKISKTFTVASSDASPKVVALDVAPATGTLEGGAFNILNDLLLVNEYLRAHANPNTTSTNPDYCTTAICNGTFTVAPKVQVYWTKGLSPLTYYGEPSSPSSFFVPESGGGIYTGLYLLGGIEGSVCVDTDHFDNTIIVHEYGHFLEKMFATSDSPGGSHGGSGVIDPRLAWSEGWANFLNAAVLDRPRYRDTIGNVDCPAVQVSGGNYYTARLGHNIDLETQATDIPQNSGEGNFREMAISRTLWDTLTGTKNGGTNTDGVAADLGFAVIWKAFTGLTDSNFHGRNVGHLNSLLATILNGLGSGYFNAWSGGASTPITYEKQTRDYRDFGLRLSPSASACASSTYPNPPWTFTTLGPQLDTVSSGSIIASDMFNTNDFYLYYYDGTAAHSQVILRYKLTSGSGTPWDLDLYVWKEKFVFLDDTDVVLASDRSYPESGGNGTYPGYESVNFSGKPAGYYFINVKVFFPNLPRKLSTDYTLTLGNGDNLCPP